MYENYHALNMFIKFNVFFLILRILIIMIINKASGLGFHIQSRISVYEQVKEHHEREHN